MTIFDHLLIGGAAAAAIYTVYRLFIGWRKSTLREAGRKQRPTE